MKKRFGLSGRESGQGTVEYILILVIVVIITLTLLYRFHGAFRNYAQVFFDGYVACLLDVGELPGTGSVCLSEMPKFDPKSAKYLLKDNLPEPGNGSSGGSSNAAKSADPNGQRAQANRAHRAGPAGGGGGGRGGRFRDSGRVRSSEVGKVGDGSESTFGGDDKSGASITVPTGRLRSNGQPPKVKMEINADGRIEEASDGGRPKSLKTAKNVDDGSGLRPVKTVENPSRTNASVGDGEGKGFSLGALIRLLIIILIIVAMVIFFGGQLMQIAKSQDKDSGE